MTKRELLELLPDHWSKTRKMDYLRFQYPKELRRDRIDQMIALALGALLIAGWIWLAI